MQRFDLGHLEILETLLEEESVSRAAIRLNISPSALSRTLAKIRDAVGDELLTPAGRDLTITQRGRELRGEIKKLNDQARLLLSPQEQVNPAGIRRVFRIRASDYTTTIIGTPLLKEVGHLAPQAAVGFVAQGKEDIEAFRRGTIDFDIGVTPEPNSEVVQDPLLRDRFVCAYSKHADIAGDRITMSEFISRPHVIVSRKAKTFVIIDELLAAMGKRRRVLGSVSSFQEALVMASQSDAVVQVPSRLVEMLKKPLQLKASPLPLKTPPVDITLNWHMRNKNDQEHRWLRELIFQIVRTFGPSKTS